MSNMCFYNDFLFAIQAFLWLRVINMERVNLKSNKLYYACLFSFLLIIVPVSVTAFDPPHNALSGVSCEDCHGQSLKLPLGHPLWDTGISSEEVYNAICLRCHVTDPTLGNYGETSAPLVKSHAPGPPSSNPIKCIRCHHNHYQEQLDIAVTTMIISS